MRDISNIMDTLRHPTHEDRNRQLLEQQLELICRALPRPEKEGTVSCSN